MDANLKINFYKNIGEIRALNGVNLAPKLHNQKNRNMNEAYRALKIPYARLHDVPLDNPGMRLVDIQHIFGNREADENDPRNYYFKQTTTSATVSGWERRSSTVSAQASSIRFRIIMRFPRRISTDGSQSASTSYAITTKAGRTVIHGKSSTGKSGTNQKTRRCGQAQWKNISNSIPLPRNI